MLLLFSSLFCDHWWKTCKTLGKQLKENLMPAAGTVHCSHSPRHIGVWCWPDLPLTGCVADMGQTNKSD